MAGKKILLVEGIDDEHVLKHVCANRSVGHLDEIKSQGSVHQLLTNLPVRLKESDLAVLGVVIDADVDLAARWSALSQRLKTAGYTDVPTHPIASGTILSARSEALLPRVGIWIMPNNQTEGILEDFLRLLVPPGNKLFEHVKFSVANIPEGERLFTRLAEPKAIIHTWLAWQEEPGNPFGIAIRSKSLDPSALAVDLLAGWLKRLFFL